MFCRFCGRNIEDDSLFCTYCGKHLAFDSTQVQATLPQESEPLAIVPPPEQPTSAISTAQSSQPEPPVVISEMPASTPEDAPHPSTKTPVTYIPESFTARAATAPSVSQNKRWAVLACTVLVLACVICVLFGTKILCIHRWQDATCTSPSICSRCQKTKGEALNHLKKSATCTDPITCKRCGETFGSALQHDIREATCTSGRTCLRCHMVFGSPIEHSWTEETFTTPKTCENCGEIAPMTQPESGTVYEDSKHHGSKLTFYAASKFNTFVKLKDENGITVLSFYVRAGQSADIRVPTGNYYLYFAHGYDWYGPEAVFGTETVYEKAEEVLDFYNYTWTYTLDVGEEGNSTVLTISEDDF